MLKNKQPMTLSKSDYILFLKHPSWLWLKKFEKNKLPPVDENLQSLFDMGNEFEEIADKLFSGAVRVGFDMGDFDTYVSMVERTKEALGGGASAILQGRFEVDGLTCIVDVLESVGEGVFDLIEVKASTRAKVEHEYDLAFQVLVLEKSGLKIRNISIIHANKEYVKKGEVEPEEITTRTDVTNKVRGLVGVTKEQVGEAFKIMSSKVVPNISPRFVNGIGVSGVRWFEEWMEIFKSLKGGVEKYSIYNLSYPNALQIGKLEDMGISEIGKVPESLALRPKQGMQIKLTREGGRVLEKEKISDFIETFKYPLYFIDYETFSSVIPFFDGCFPYGDYPFQYSLHIVDSPGAKPRHVEYLHVENSNPMLKLIEKLKSDVGEVGTILSWNMSYEKGCNDRMASMYPEHKEFLDDMNVRMNDLMIPFSNMWFFDKDFFGSASLKKVLPVVVPELNYSQLDVSDGLLARRLWTETIIKGKNKDKKEKIMSSLSEYCTLDTFAMVRILEELQKL